MNWKKASSLRFMAPISSPKAAISSVHPQVGDGEGNGADAAAVAPALSSTQKAVRHWSRKVPLILGSATFFLGSAAAFWCVRSPCPSEP
eukprot:scaffold12272_cov65-Phaeocystis_antarctica.AAC.4